MTEMCCPSSYPLLSVSRLVLAVLRTASTQPAHPDGRLADGAGRLAVDASPGCPGPARGAAGTACRCRESCRPILPLSSRQYSAGRCSSPQPRRRGQAMPVRPHQLARPRVLALSAHPLQRPSRRRLRTAEPRDVDVPSSTTREFPASLSADTAARRSLLKNPTSTPSAVLAHGTHTCAAPISMCWRSLPPAAFWFSPAAWWLHTVSPTWPRRERCGSHPDIFERVRYVSILLDFVVGPSRSPLALATARASNVRQRVERILAESIMPRQMVWKAWAALADSIVR